MSTVNQTSSAVIEPPKLSRRRWGIILILLLAAVVNYLDRANLSIANTTISKEFGFSGTEMGLLLSALCAGKPAGRLAGRPFRPKEDVHRRADAMVCRDLSDGICEYL